jgi:hypothetical protein
VDGLFVVFFRLSGRQEGPDGMAEVPCELRQEGPDSMAEVPCELRQEGPDG